ncbi:AraC family transcriptional regulator [Ruegeria profundi]|nr:AraC family transcriptional regulator [Ruegeria profundi]
MTTIRGWGNFPRMVEEMASAKALRTILRRHDLPLSVLCAPDRRIPLAKMIRVIEAAGRTVGCDEFGVQLGARTTAQHYGPWAGFAYCAPNLGQALKRVCATLPAHEIGSRMYLAEHKDHLVWCYESGLAKVETVRHFTDHLFETVLVFFRGFLGANWRPDWVEVDYDQPAKIDRLEALVDAKILFGRPNFGVAVRKTDLEARLVSGLPFTRPLLSLDLKTSQDRTNAERCDGLLEVIDLRLMDGEVDLDGCAKVIDIGPRTLQRKLAKRGLTYQDLLENARRRRAIAFLSETDLPVKTIAMELGYTEPENFTRAFRKWQNVTPTDFRSKAVDTS